MMAEHHSVLLQEVIDGLVLSKGATFFDGTLGGGGHSAAVCEALGGDVRIIGLDADHEAVARGKSRVRDAGCSGIFLESNFRYADRVLRELRIGRELDGALLDLGLSSFQLEEGKRGFSFQKDEPLIMTFAASGDGLTAEEVVNDWGGEELARIIAEYGEERLARRYAHAILSARKGKRITRSKELEGIIYHATPSKLRGRRIHPATRTFQAIRIAVNDELETLKEGLRGIEEHLAPGGRLAVISFHSLEDRIVKETLRAWASEGRGVIQTKKPITPFEEEIEANPRSRSAKLRIYQSQ